MILMNKAPKKKTYRRVGPWLKNLVTAGFSPGLLIGLLKGLFLAECTTFFLVSFQFCCLALSINCEVDFNQVTHEKEISTHFVQPPYLMDDGHENQLWKQIFFGC
jgi:hypothetical protein